MNYLLIEEHVWIDLQAQIRQLCSIVREIDARFYPQGMELLDASGVCERLHISKRTLQNYRERGLVAYTSIRNKYYYRVADIATLLSQKHI